MGHVVTQLQQARTDMPRLAARFDFANDGVALAGDVDPRENVDAAIRPVWLDAHVANFDRGHFLQKRGQRSCGLLFQAFH